MGRVATLILAVAAACRGEPTDAQPRGGTRVEQAIERAVAHRVRAAVRVRCVWLAVTCRATLPDGEVLRVRLGVSRGEVVWALDGALVFAHDIEAYLRDALADLGAPQTAACGPRVQSVTPGDRVQCRLQHGGKAFVVVNADGTTSIEIALDPTAGDARAEAVTIERDESLLRMSRALEQEAEDDDGE